MNIKLYLCANAVVLGVAVGLICHLYVKSTRLEAKYMRLHRDMMSALDGVSPTSRRLQSNLVNRVGRLESKLKCVLDKSDAGDIFFSGCNVHIQNGRGVTYRKNGKGNLIVGYNRENCEVCQRTGSHNVIIGDSHSWTKFSGFVAGQGNSLLSARSSILGGINNVAQKVDAVIAGGCGQIVTKRTCDGP